MTANEVIKHKAEREAVIQKIIEIILEDLEAEEKGNLTSTYAIRILQEAIAHIEGTALMRPLRHSLIKPES